MIDDVNDVASYTVSYNSTYILRWESSGSNVVKSICFISEKAQGYARRHLKIMG